MDKESGNSVQSVSVKKVLDSKLGVRSSRVPAFVVRMLERLIKQDELNAMLRECHPKRGADFCKAVMEHLGVQVQVHGEENMPASPRCIFVSNHPLGGLDGMALIQMISSRYGIKPYFVVNDILMAIEPLRDVFLPVNKHGSQSRQADKHLNDILASDSPVIIFPAGLCSRRRRGKVADLPWHKMFLSKARQYHRPIVPIYFHGRNSSAFYRTANWRKRLHIKFNIEMLLLPREVFKARGKTFDIYCGKPLAVADLPNTSPEYVRNIVYNLKNEHENHRPH